MNKDDEAQRENTQSSEEAETSTEAESESASSDLQPSIQPSVEPKTVSRVEGGLLKSNLGPIITGFAIGIALAIGFIVINEFFPDLLSPTRVVYIQPPDDRGVIRTISLEAETIVSESEAPSLLDKKKKELQDHTPVDFIYIDEEAITEFYNITFKDPIYVEEIRKEIEKRTGEVGSGELSEPLVRSQIAGETIEEVVKTTKFSETTVPEMFAKYKDHILDNDKVNYGFDAFEIRLEEISKFEDELVKIEERYGISAFPGEIRGEKIQEIRKKLVNEILTELETVKQLVLVEGKYKITEEGGSIKLTYEHPINEHLTYLPDAHVQIVCFLEKSLLENGYRANYPRMAREEKVTSITIFGKVLLPIDRENNNWDLVIRPLAIY